MSAEKTALASTASFDSTFSGLDLLGSAVLVLDRLGQICYVNSAAEVMLETSQRMLCDQSLTSLFQTPEQVLAILEEGRTNQFSNKRQDLVLQLPGNRSLEVHCTFSVSGVVHAPFVVELQEIDKQRQFDREERLLDQTQLNKELIRNLAHEIKNPLGGIRGAAQLLEAELPAAELREYTQVIIKESDRLQTLVDRLLAPHRRPHIVGDVNIHEVCERVRSVILAEFPKTLKIVRNYDISVPEFRGDKEQLIQALMNIVRNAAQAMQGVGRIELRSRIARQVTLVKKRYRLALDLHVIDNGPGIPESIRDRIFYPLVSGRQGGSGLGLTLAQTFVQQHDGLIECTSQTGQTDFRILIPLP